MTSAVSPWSLRRRIRGSRMDFPAADVRGDASAERLALNNRKRTAVR